MMKNDSYKQLANSIWYQVFLQSFHDSNGDGIGDLPGLIEKLDYIQELGCNGIWVTPFYESPFRDAGYDVSDYRLVASRYGDNDDARRLFREAHARGIRVIIDLVLGHTALEHPWFRESSHPLPNGLANRYIWTNSVNTRPSAPLEVIRGLAARDAGYVANYFYHQPALNYGFAVQDADWQLPPEHPDCRATVEEIRQIMDFWLKMGVDGFRVDMAHCLVKNDKDKAATIRIYQEWREWMDREHPGTILLSEWGEAAQAIEAGFDMDFLLPSKHDPLNDIFRRELDWLRFEDAERFSYFRKAGKGSFRLFSEWIEPLLESVREKGLLAIPSGNHDSARLGYKRDSEEMKVCFAFLLTSPCVPFIYYGDEIGMDIPQDVPNVEGGYQRSANRTPMQWSSGQNAGFSTAAAENLYLPLDPAPGRPDVETQMRNGESLWCLVQRLCRLRRSHTALGAAGGFELLEDKTNAYPTVYRRFDGQSAWLVVLNPSEHVASRRLSLGQMPEPQHWRIVEGHCTWLPSNDTGVVDLQVDGCAFAVIRLDG